MFAVSSKWCSTSCHWHAAVWSYHPSSPLVALVRQRIHFKIAECVFKALTGQAPAYLADDCRLISDPDCRKLRSSDIRTRVTPERLCDSVTEVFQLLVLKFGMVNHLCCRLRTLCFTVSNDDLRPICLHWCYEISVPSDCWFLALYKFSLGMYVSM